MFGQLSGITGLSFPIVAGVAICTGLSINLVGSGYTLQFASLFHGLQTESSPFDILLGPPFKLSMYTYIGVAQGGTPFLPQPVVSIVDKGGNIVDSVSQGTVSVSILSNPVGGILTPSSSYTVWIYQGLGKFFDLKIDKAGGPYVLRFLADSAVVLPGGNKFDTFPFTVSVGPAKTMVISEHPIAAFGGEAFTVQPTITLIDAGLNVLGTQTNMQVVATIYSNPSKGTLLPVVETRSNIIDGLASFKNLRIDAAGNNYELRFAVKTPDARGIYVETGLFVVGPSFNVYIGTLFTVAVVRPPQSAIAGVSHMRFGWFDRGANVIVSENLALVTVSMVPSLALYNTLILSTASPVPATVVDVTLLPSTFTSPFGAGTDLVISISFSQEVIATGDVQLQLNSGVGATGRCTTLLTWTRSLSFTYGITPGHAATALNYVNTVALVLVAGTINDRLGNSASILLPDPTTGGLRPVVAVETTAPSIVSVGCGGATVAGTFGPGQDLVLAVSFSAPVSILGVPPAAVPVPTLTLNVLVPQVATYISGNGTQVLLFRYSVGLMDTLTPSALLDVTASVNMNGASLRRAGTTPNQAAEFTMPVNALQRLPSQCAIAIDSTVVTVDAALGVTSPTAPGVYTPGDVITIVVPFTKAVVVSGIPLLFLNTAQNAIYAGGSGTTQLTFRYTVAAGDISLDLNYASDNALLLNGGSIRRYVTAGSAIADVNPSLAAVTAATKSLADQNAIQIDGRTPTILNVALAAPATKTRGDSVTFSITFSYAVVVDGGPPRLTLNTNRRALYTSGSGTATLVFTYQVLLGDSTPSLAYSAVAALGLNGGTIRKKSATPTLAADLSLPWPPNLLNGPVVVDPNIAYVTTVTGFVCDLPAADYGLNQVLQISVMFSDIVQVIGSVQLGLQTQAIQYASGSGTSTLVFLYVVRANDITPSLDIASTAPFSCAGATTCSIVNANFAAVNLDCTGLTLQPPGISISTDAPTVVSIAAITTAPTINSNSFVVGDIIDILMVVSKKVHVDPSPDVFPDKVPLLAMSTGRTGAVAHFIGYGIDRTQLIFRYIVQVGDMTSNLMYAGVNSLSLNFNQATIKRLTTNPTTNMNLLLPTPQALGVALKIDTSRTPFVTNVLATTPDGTYFCGDLITIQVFYSENVVVTGQPVLKLDLGKNDRNADFVGGSGTPVLTFQYAVGQDDTSRDLRYIDVKSLFVPIGASILHRASIPTVKANNRLPFPGTHGSLSANNNLVVRGTSPYITDISFVTVNGTYTVNNVIQVAVTFTTTVTVTGVPYLELRTGVVLRRAVYLPAGPNTKLVFQYRVETGDVSSKLDYSSTSALTLNGGAIMTTPTLAGRSPVQPANPQLNPPGGALSGVRIIQASLGRVSYIDLGIDTMGLKYVIYFSTPPDIVASVMFDVTYSAVWEVRNSPINVHNRGDKTGWSVDVNGAVAIVGSAGAMAKQYNVQEITAWGSATSYVDEVQYVQTTCVHRDAIQVLVSSVAPGETVGGYFSLMYGAVGPTRRLAADFDAVQLEVALQLDFGLPDSGVEVSREQNTYCGCTNAYQWTITFHTQGDVPTLVARNYLTGNGATIGDGKGGASAMVITRPPVVSGQFALRYGTITTQNMPSNVDAATMAARLALDLSLPIRSVARSEPTIQNGYTWSITFSSSSTLFNINELQPAPVFLTGNQVLLTVTTVREGQAPLYGNFRLGLGNEATVDIPVTAPDTTMKAALESLSQIKTVHVARSPQNPFGGYTWTVTFIEINTLTIYGLVLSNLGTLPPLTPITRVHNVPILLGSDAAILVDYAGVNPSLYSSAVQGNAPGESAGSATVFVPYNKQWVQSALLVGSDTHVGDQFGASVALSLTGAQAVVGAPYAAALQATIASLLKVQAQFIQVVPYATLCTGAVIVITLATPDLSDPTGNIPELVADASLLTNGGVTGGTVAIQSVVQGSLREDGPKAKGTPCGGAYFFSSPSAGVWTQVVKVTPTQGSETLSSEFGASVSLEGNFAAVGAPGAGYAKGEVYVYQFNGVTWSLYQKLTVSPYVSVQGDRFGDAVKVSDTTIVVGAPGYAGTVGAVFVFQLVNGVFVNRQQLQVYCVLRASSTMLTFDLAKPGDLAIGDFFGSAVAVDMQTSTIAVSSKWHNRRGAVYVYYSPDLFFSLQQIVQGSDLRQHDGFGQSVAIVKNVLVVGANERFNSNRDLTIRKAIQTITTSASSSLGNTFRVGFRMVADGVEVDYVYVVH
ncbi:hypothetical protein DYB30_002527, partial [Aphanomyces astaci]